MNTGGTPISQKLSQLREAKGVTQETIAALFGLSNKTVSKWENGLSSPDLEYIPVLADYFGVTIDELFGRDDHRKLDIGATIRTHLKDYNAAQCMGQALALSNNIFTGCVRHFFDKNDESKHMDDYPIPARVITDDNSATRNAIYSDVGFQFIISSDPLNLSVFLPGNVDNFATVMRQAEEYQPVFAFLGKSGSIHILSALFHKEFPPRFTAEYMSQKTGLDPETTSELLEESVKCSICRRSMAELRDGSVEIYDFIGNGMILTILCLAYEYACGKSTHYQRFRGTNKMIKGDL
jgi:transcriptional regulator with XRE-family HTH domain